MTVSVMLDLETWGTRPGCDIRSIGAVVFDPVSDELAALAQADIGHRKSGGPVMNAILDAARVLFA